VNNRGFISSRNIGCRSWSVDVVGGPVQPYKQVFRNDGCAGSTMLAMLAMEAFK
jgi:hypothetical protein